MFENRHTLWDNRQGMIKHPALNPSKHCFPFCAATYLNRCGKDKTRTQLKPTLRNQATRVVEATGEEHTHGWQSCSKVAVRNIEERTDSVKSRVRKR